MVEIEAKMGKQIAGLLCSRAEPSLAIAALRCDDCKSNGRLFGVLALNGEEFDLEDERSVRTDLPAGTALAIG